MAVAKTDGRTRSPLVAACFGDNLANTRRRLGLTQEEVAAKAGLHRTEIGMLEAGTRLARVDTLMKLLAALDVPPNELLRGLDRALEGRVT